MRASERTHAVDCVIVCTVGLNVNICRGHVALKLLFWGFYSFGRLLGHAQ